MPIKSAVQALIITTISLSVWGCAGLKDLARTQTPTVSIANVSFGNISFSDVTLLFDLKVDNPNPIAAPLLGFDYKFSLNNQSFLTGDKNEAQTIEANGASTIQFPLKLNFNEVYKTIAALKNQDSTTYGIDFGLKFDLPLIGAVRLPVSKKGALPLLKLPTVNLGSVDLKKVGLTGADLLVKIGINNPNSFSTKLHKLDYALQVGGKPLVSGLQDKMVQINAKGKSTIEIPVKVNFFQAGTTLLGFIKNKDSLKYNLTGSAALEPALKGLGLFNFPFNKQGQVKLNR